MLADVTGGVPVGPDLVLRLKAVVKGAGLEGPQGLGAESLGEAFAGDWLSGQQPGEQQFAVGRRAGAGAGLAVDDEDEQQAADGPWDGRSC